MVLLRHVLGDALRRLRLRQGRTLREVSAAARVSLGYLSEVERGQKEASSELLAAICTALETPLSQVLREVSDGFALAELQNAPVFTGAPEPAAGPASAAGAGTGQLPVRPLASARMVPAAGRPMVPAGSRLPVGSGRMVPIGPSQRLVASGASKMAAGAGRQIVPAAVPVLGPVAQPAVERVSRSAREITSMVPV